MTLSGAAAAGPASDADRSGGVTRPGARVDSPRSERKSPALRDLPTLVSVADAASRLAVSLRTFRSIIAAGQLPVVRVSARRIAIDTADLAEFVERRRERAGGR